MLNGDIRSKIDTLWNAFWTGAYPIPSKSSSRSPIPLAETTSRLFMAAYLGTDFVQRYFTNELRTVSQPTLNIKQLSETTVVLPPISLQREFARRVTAVEALKTAQRASLAEMDALFATLQHRAFRGEL